MSFSFSLDVTLPPNEWEHLDFALVVNNYATILRQVLNQNKNKLPDDLETRAQMDNRGPSIHDHDFDVNVDDPEDPTKVIVSHPVEHMPLLYYGNTPGEGSGVIRARRYRPQRAYALSYTVHIDQFHQSNIDKYIGMGATITDDAAPRGSPPIKARSMTHHRVAARFTRTGTSISTEPKMVFYNKKVGHWMMKSEVRGNASVVPVVKAWFLDCELEARIRLKEELDVDDLLVELQDYEHQKSGYQHLIGLNREMETLHHEESRKYRPSSKEFAREKAEAGYYYSARHEAVRERNRYTRKIRETKKKLREKGY